MDLTVAITALRAAGAPDAFLRSIADLHMGKIASDAAVTEQIVSEFERLRAAEESEAMVAALEALADVKDALEDVQVRRTGRSPAARPRRLPSLGEANAARGRGARPAARTAALSLTASATTPAGRPITGPADLAEHMSEVLRRAKPGDRVLIASSRWAYPVERRLGGDLLENDRRIGAVVDPAAVVASGGVCGPVNVDYGVMVESSADRPLAGDLPTFQADRGGLRFMQPPTFAGVGASGTTVWTEATDANPGGATKPVQTIACGTEEEVFVDAIPTRLKFGNMQARFFPEMVSANTALALANAARVQDLNLLAKIATYSTPVSSGQLLGAARDLLATVDQAAAAYRYRSRLPRTTPMRAVMPGWVIDLCRADLARSEAHGDDAALAVTDAQVNGWFSARNVAVTWMEDGMPAQAAAGGTPPTIGYGYQGFGAQAAGVALLDWPHTLVWYLFAEGTFQRLDGGQMDIGIVRDSVLDSTNDYETFVEIFEGIAMRGFESLQVISSLRPNGSAAASIATAAPQVY